MHVGGFSSKAFFWCSYLSSINLLLRCLFTQSHFNLRLFVENIKTLSAWLGFAKCRFRFLTEFRLRKTFAVFDFRMMPSSLIGWSFMYLTTSALLWIWNPCIDLLARCAAYLRSWLMWWSGRAFESVIAVFLTQRVRVNFLPWLETGSLFFIEHCPSLQTFTSLLSKRFTRSRKRSCETLVYSLWKNIVP